MLDVRKDFPILSRRVNGKKLVYLDNAASTQSPRSVIDAVSDYFGNHHANVHRGVHTLSAEATELLENARREVAGFINATPEEVIFVRNTTEALNLVARSYGDAFIGKNDSIVLTQLEHHSNIVPWQQLANRTGAKLHYARINGEGMLEENHFAELLAGVPRITAFTGASNALGSLTPVRKMARLVRAAGAVSVLDAAQLAPHGGLDVKRLGVDFAAFSGHKLYGPTGIGVLYGRKELLEKMPAFLGGGDMIREVSWDSFTVNDLPYKFEAGTPNISGAIGLAAAVRYLSKIGLAHIARHEAELTRQTLDLLGQDERVVLYGPPASKRASIVSFNYGSVHAHDVASVLDSQGVAIRSGHHCAMPLMGLLGVPATARASFALYNTPNDVEALASSLKKVGKIFG